MDVILSADQERRLRRVADTGQALASAKAAARDATDDVKEAVSAALAARVPVSRVAEAAGVERSLIYYWRSDAEAAA